MQVIIIWSICLAKKEALIDKTWLKYYNITYVCSRKFFTFPVCILEIPIVIIYAIFAMPMAKAIGYFYRFYVIEVRTCLVYKTEDF